HSLDQRAADGLGNERVDLGAAAFRTDEGRGRASFGFVYHVGKVGIANAESQRHRREQQRFKIVERRESLIVEGGIGCVGGSACSVIRIRIAAIASIFA